MSKQLIPVQETILKLQQNGDHHNAVSICLWECRADCYDFKVGSALEKKHFIVWPREDSYKDGPQQIKMAEFQTPGNGQTITREMPNV